MKLKTFICLEHSSEKCIFKSALASLNIFIFLSVPLPSVVSVSLHPLYFKVFHWTLLFILLVFINSVKQVATERFFCMLLQLFLFSLAVTEKNPNFISNLLSNVVIIIPYYMMV